MLKHIYDFAEKNDLTGDSRYRKKYIKYHVVLNESGNLICIEENSDKQNKTICPCYPDRILYGNTSNFLVTSGQIVFDKSNKKHNSYLNDLRGCAASSVDIKIIVDFIEKFSNDSFIKDLEDETLKKGLFSMKNESAMISFRINERYIEKLESWKPYFESKFKEFVDAEIAENAENPQMISVVSQNVVTPILRTDKILVSGATTGTGDVLICCDKPAFKSYGLDGALNGAISREESEIIKWGLEYLLENNYNSSWNLIHWYKDTPKFDPIAFHLSPRNIVVPGIPNDENFESKLPEEKDFILYEFLKNLTCGKLIQNASEIEDSEYYLLNFKPCSGRIAFSNFRIGNFNELLSNLERFYKDSEMMCVWKDGESGNQKISVTPILNLYSVFFNLLNTDVENVNKKFDKINDEFGTHKKQQLFDAVFCGRQIPTDFVIRAINHICRDKVNKRRTSPVVYKILKTYINRSVEKGEDVILPYLNKENKDIAYNLGRMLSVYQKIQYEALGDVKASIISRYYSSAASSPAYVFDTLSRLSNHHLKKLSVGRAVFFRKLLQEIAGNIDSYPVRLNIRERANFSLGYYQQEQAFYIKNSENNISNMEENNNVE